MFETWNRAWRSRRRTMWYEVVLTMNAYDVFYFVHCTRIARASRRRPTSRDGRRSAAAPRTTSRTTRIYLTRYINTLPLSLAIAKTLRSSDGENATSDAYDRGVPLVGQFLATCFVFKWTSLS